MSETLIDKFDVFEDYCLKHGDEYLRNHRDFFNMSSKLSAGIVELAEENIQLKNELAEIRNWRPMETAPKDGTYILLKENGEVYEAAWETYPWIVITRKSSFKAWCIWGTEQDEQGGCATVDNPEGWMPLPSTESENR